MKKLQKISPSAIGLSYQRCGKEYTLLATDDEVELQPHVYDYTIINPAGKSEMYIFFNPME